MNHIKIFNNEEFGQVRTTKIEGKAFFCLVDICEALDLDNPSKVKKRLFKTGLQLVDLHALTTIQGVSINELQEGIIGNSVSTFISEPNLYRCIFQSRKPSAEKFQNWVFEEVLPAIRKTGEYKVAYPYRKKIDHLEKQRGYDREQMDIMYQWILSLQKEMDTLQSTYRTCDINRLREVDSKKLELMERWVVNVKGERDMYKSQLDAYTATICTRDLAQEEALPTLGKALKSLCRERGSNYQVLAKMMGDKSLREKLAALEKGEGDLLVSVLLNALSQLDYSIQFVRNENFIDIDNE
jgi:prophage antirepressor-like protein